MSLNNSSQPCQEMFIDYSPFTDPSESYASRSKTEEWDGWVAIDNSLQSSGYDFWRQSDEFSIYESQSCAMDLDHNAQVINYPKAPANDAQFELDDPILSPQFQLQSVPGKNDVRRQQLLRGQHHLEQRGRNLNSYSALPVIEEQGPDSVTILYYVPTEVPSLADQERADSAELQLKMLTRKTNLKSLKKNHDQNGKSKCRKQAHNAVEKRYRLSLNEKIAELRQHVPNLRSEPDGLTEGDNEENPGAVNKFGKASILTGAIEYISELEKSTRQSEAEIAALKARVEAFEKLDASILTFPSSGC